jgi:multidrug transporter EmrE-like cation transporter
MFYVTAISSALLYAIGSIYMMRSQGLSQLLPSLMMFGFYIGGATLQTLATYRFSNSMGLTYMFVLGIEAAIAPLPAVVWLQERYSMSQYFGIFLVFCGIIFLRAVKL